MKAIHQDLGTALDPRWRRYIVGAGALEPAGAALRFTTTDATARQYSDAQLDDDVGVEFHGLPRRRFHWRPPLRLTVRARFSHPAGQLRGTAGFGFWNDPFLMSGARLPALPRALWFFYASPPSNLKLDLHTPGRGWKAAVLDAQRPAALLLAPLAPLAVLLMKLRPLYRALWPPIQRALKVREAMLTVDMTRWHTYVLEWERDRARFRVGADNGQDPVAILDAPSPRGPLGFVAWLDNQYMVVTPWGRLRWGLLDAPGRQWMEIEHLSISGLDLQPRPSKGIVANTLCLP